MRVADALALPADLRESLFYALLMKDLGCSSNAARFAALFGHDDHEIKAALATLDWRSPIEAFRFVATNVAPGQSWARRAWHLFGLAVNGPAGARALVQTRCERGADIARLLGLSNDTVQAIRGIDEHWDGHGQPYARAGEDTPLLARIVGLSQTVEVFSNTYGVSAAYDMATARRGRWFDPHLVDALCGFRRDHEFWRALADGSELHALGTMAPADTTTAASEDALDRITEGFAQVVDAKSPWTYQHSNGVAMIAVAIAERLGLTPQECRTLRRAALLHDLGKLAVSNLILDKPGRLTDAELTAVRTHPAHTAAVLQRVSCLAPIAGIAAAHHERLDGQGYHHGLDARTLPLAARVLAVADICDALRASRPYRAGLTPDQVMEVLKREAGTGVDPDCVAALQEVIADLPAEPNATPACVVTALAEDYTQAA